MSAFPKGQYTLHQRPIVLGTGHVDDLSVFNRMSLPNIDRPRRPRRTGGEILSGNELFR
jgi:hypothetical protein